MGESKNKLILISGLPGSGKSTYGREIAKQYHLTYIDYDTVIGSFMEKLVEQEQGGKTYSDLQREWRSSCYQSFWNLIIENLRIGLPVIASAPLSAEQKDQNFFYKLGKRYQINLDVLCISLAVPADILYQMVLARNEERDQEKLSNWQEYYQNQSINSCWDARIKVKIKHNEYGEHSNEIKEFLQEYEVL